MSGAKAQSTTSLPGDTNLNQTIVVADGRYMHHLHKHRHKIAVFIVALGALILLLRTQAKTLQTDWTPVGMGVKFLLLASVAGLVYYPYELFVKGPTEVNKALKLR